jgi:hypothetical protein
MPARRYSGLGLASFVTSIVFAAGLLGLSAILLLIDTSVVGGLDEDSVGAAFLGFLILACLAGSLVSLGLGIAALTQADRSKTFAFLGIVFSAVAFISTISVLVLGVAISEGPPR